MTIQLKPEQERIIQEEIRSGHFQNAAEVLDHALAALRDKEQNTPLEVGIAAGRISTPIKPVKNLVEVLCEAPFAGSELNLERQRDYPRPLAL